MFTIIQMSDINKMLRITVCEISFSKPADFKLVFQSVDASSIQLNAPHDAQNTDDKTQ